MNSESNESDIHDQPDEQQMLDRLVDGELNEQQRRALLLRLENQHDGWRRCALAFLEAQAWGRELRSVTAPAATQHATAFSPAHRGNWLAGRWGTLLATAASFLVALGLGSLWQRAEQGAGDKPGEAQIATNAPAKPPISKPPPAAGRSPRGALLDPNSPQAQFGTVVVSLDGNQDGVAESLEVPVVAGGGLDESWLHNQPGSLPPHVLRALERLGHRVEQNRQYYPIDLNDGRRVVVPVDQVDVHYVGDRTYQ
jgi:hypothetical protein